MSDLNQAASSNNRRAILFVLLGLVAIGGVCVCTGAVIGYPAFEAYVDKSKAIEAELSVKKIAQGAKMHFESSPDCTFPESAGPLPALLDCCADACRRTEAQMNERGWNQVSFDTTQMYRFRYETRSSDDDRFLVRASSDFDCDDVRSTYAVEVRATNRTPGACQATIGEPVQQQPFE